VEYKNVNVKNVLSIDPGLHTGLAYFPDDFIVPDVMDFNVDYKAKTIAEKLDSLLIKLDVLDLYKLKIEWVVIEGVQIWATSLKSMTAATRGNLSLLAYIVGAYYQYFNGLFVEIISPQWKGQLPISALRVWIKQINGQEYRSDHINAAVGLGLWKKGLIK
jgi:hypothetical protein